ncbi:MAG TPA: hypothetical protein VM031_05260 [Phycisphaerae bacterium]|nr:hypothetical protein [Phycisphaerae bacterium]
MIRRHAPQTTSSVSTALALLAGLTLTAAMTRPAGATLLELRDLVGAEASLQHWWTFEGSTEAVRLQDNAGVAALTRVTTGGTPASFVAGYAGEGLAAQSYRTDITTGSGYVSSSFTFSAGGTAEYLFCPTNNAGGHIVSASPNPGRMYFGLNDGTGLSADPPAAAVGFGNGAWPSPRAEFLTNSTSPNFEAGHWYYVAVPYQYSSGGGANFTFDVYVADLTESQTALTHAVAGASRPAANSSMNSVPLGIGMQGNTSNNAYEGATDEVALYGTKLSSATLQQHLDAIYAPPGPPPPGDTVRILVSDTANARVLQYDLATDGTLTYDKVFADPSTVPSLSSPKSMARVGDKLYMTQTGADPRVWRLDLDGNLEAEIPAPAVPWTRLGGDLVAQDGALYVADTFGTNHIYRIDNPESASPTVSVLINASVAYDGQTMDRPRGLAFSPMGNLIVGDRNRNRFLEFSPDGTFLRRFDSGTAPNTAQSLVWHDDQLYATTSNAVQRWNVHGSYVGNYLSPAPGLGLELAFTPDDDLFYVAYTDARLYRRTSGSTVAVAAGDGALGEGSYAANGPTGLLVLPETVKESLWIRQTDVSPNPSQLYCGSPSIVRLPNNNLLASHDWFGPAAPTDASGQYNRTSLALSNDDGKSWADIGDLDGQFWSGLFVHDGSVYTLGTSARYGSVVIRRSDDGGLTWTQPLDEHSGLLLAGGNGTAAPNYHTAPVPVLIKDGRIYRALEDNDPLNWPGGFQSFVVSADLSSNLLEASSWTVSNKLGFNPAWVPAGWTTSSPGWLEGNVVEAPNGEIWNILRFNADPEVDKAAIVRVSADGTLVTFDPANGFIDFPGGGHKFTIRRDPVTGLYFTLVNDNTDPNYPSQRNLLSLFASADLIIWEHLTTLLEDDQDLLWAQSVALTGFQYADWQFDGDDLIYLVRTAYDGAPNYHDANRVTFHRLEDFRGLLGDAIPEPCTAAGLLAGLACLVRQRRSKDRKRS